MEYLQEMYITISFPQSVLHPVTLYFFITLVPHLRDLLGKHILDLTFRFFAALRLFGFFTISFAAGTCYGVENII